MYLCDVDGDTEAFSIFRVTMYKSAHGSPSPVKAISILLLNFNANHAGNTAYQRPTLINQKSDLAMLLTLCPEI